MKLAILQLCRMGDIVQTLPVAAALREDGNTVHLVLREGFRDLPISNDVADRSYYLPGPADPEGAEAQSRRLERLSEVCQELRAERYDLVINLSHDVESSWLSLYLEAGSVRGMLARRDRSIDATDPWIQYLLCLPNHRVLGALNLADVYGFVAGVSSTPPADIVPEEEVRARAHRALVDKGLVMDKRVGIVPGASEFRKQWSPSSFGRLVGRLSRLGIGSAVLGTSAEDELVQRVIRGAGEDARVAGFAGDTDLLGLAALLRELDAVVTNDTGTMHLAAAVGTPTIAVTLGPAYVHESAPYGEGHFAVQPELHCHPCDFESYCADTICHELVPVDVVLELVLATLEGRVPEGLRRNGVRVFRTSFDSLGRLAARPLLEPDLTVEDLFRFAYRRLWETSLPLSREPESETAILEEIACDYRILDTRDIRDRSERALELAESLAETLEEGCRRVLRELRSESSSSSSSMSPGSREPSEPDWLRDLSDRVELFGATAPLLRPLTSLTILQLKLTGSRSRTSAVHDLLRTLTGATNRTRQLVPCVRSLLAFVERHVGPPSSEDPRALPVA